MIFGGGVVPSSLEPWLGLSSPSGPVFSSIAEGLFLFRCDGITSLINSKFLLPLIVGLLEKLPSPYGLLSYLKELFFGVLAISKRLFFGVLILIIMFSTSLRLPDLLALSEESLTSRSICCASSG
jgi:hypothetical protein